MSATYGRHPATGSGGDVVMRRLRHRADILKLESIAAYREVRKSITPLKAS